MREYQKHTNWRFDLKSSIIGTIILTILINLLLSGCGSFRLSSINERDSLNLATERAQTKNGIKYSNAKTSFQVSKFEAQTKAMKTISADAKKATNGKYLGFVGNNFRRYKIRYDVLLDGIIIGSWEVSANSSSAKELPIGNYQIVAYRQKGNEWVEPKTWDIEVTNLAKFDGYHFRLNGFE